MRHGLSPRHLFAGLAGLALMLVGCQAMPEGLTLPMSAKFRPGGAPAVTVRPEVAPERGVLAAADPLWAPKDVDHIVIGLYRLELVDATVTEVEVASRSVDNFDHTRSFQLVEQEFTFNNLHADTAYRIRGFAYSGDASDATTLISKTDLSSAVDFTTTNNDRPTPVGIKIRLKDRPYDGTGLARGIAVEEGDYLPFGFVKNGAGFIPDPDLPASGLPDYAPDPLQDHFATPTALAYEADSGNLWVADSGNHMIRKAYFSSLSTTLGNVTTVLGQPGAPGFDAVPTPRASASVNNPQGLAVGSNGKVYIADTGNHCIRVLDTQTDTVSVLAGQGPATPGFDDGFPGTATFNAPRGLFYDLQRDMLFVADTGNHAIRVVDPGSGEVKTLAGQGFANLQNHATTGSQVGFNEPSGVMLGGDILIITDTGNHRIRTVKLDFTGAMPAFAGSATLAGISQGSADGDETVACFNRPVGIVGDRNRNLYITDSDNHRIRLVKVDGAGNVNVSTFAGNLPGRLNATRTQAQFLVPTGLAFHAQSGTLFVADTHNHRIRLVD